ncbi:helix-turn-helix domain-containing protein [Corynebacterium bovis]|uniref:helix-turn-helix domain-containing protein n=1 Tax=Corynebacterium bovis TaxID=36808 RepID=UPI003CC71CB1
MSSEWWEYLAQIRGDISDRQLARRLGVTPTTVSRWKKGMPPDAGIAAHAARVCGGSVLAGLVAAGIITADEAGLRQGDQPSLADVPVRALLEEIERRINQLEGTEGSGSGKGNDRSDIGERLIQ